MKTLSLLLLIFTSPSLWAQAISVGQPLPAVTIEKPGALALDGDKIRFETWESSQLSGRVHVLQYLAGRMSASKLNEPLTDRLDAEDFPESQHQVTTIINLDDILWGTSGFVMSELKSNKKRYPQAGIVADGEGTGLAEWQLQPEGSAIAVLDPAGQVLFFKDGALTEAEIEQVVAMIKAEIAKLPVLASEP